MEVKNGIIIDGVLHEAVNYSNDSSCSICSLRKECDELENRCDEWICRLIDCRYFVNRGKVTDINIDKEEEIMCNSIEWGKCEICGKEDQLERTYFYYSIHCECCGSKDENGQNRHFEMVRHCRKCPAPMPKEIHPLYKAMDGKTYRASFSNILPIDVRGEFIINEPIIKEE